MRRKILTVKEQGVQVKAGTQNYDKWCEKNRKENPRANPDILSDDKGVWLTDEITKEVQGRVQKLLALSKQILTEQQYKVFILIAVKDPPLTEREAANKLRISHGRVHQLWESARLKMEKAYVTRTI